jgi:hypothetical protein
MSYRNLLGGRYQDGSGPVVLSMQPALHDSCCGPDLSLWQSSLLVHYLSGGLKLSQKYFA